MVESEFKILITKQVQKDSEKLKQYPALKNNVKNLIEILKVNPYQMPPSYELLIGDLKGLYSRRINRQHRLVYKVLEEKKIIVIVSMWTHYEL